jgi:glycosyltransferase involved in cell wall biosynthesis
MICIVCSLPHYMAWAVREFIAETEEDVELVAFPSVCAEVPITGVESIITQKITWIQASEKRTLREILGRLPRVVVVAGWHIPCLNRFGGEVRRCGGQVIGMCDNAFHHSLADVIKAIRFRLLLRGRFDGMMVPGVSGLKLMRYYGMPSDFVTTGLYSASSNIFYSSVTLREREKKIIYVGRLDKRKNVLRVCRAFSNLYARNKEWRLELYGRGEFSNVLTLCDGIQVYDFTQGEQLADAYRSARCLILASLQENWGVVVHEAVLSGCALLLSDRVGSKNDLANEKNAVFFDPCSVRSIEKAMMRVMTFTDTEWEQAQSESERLSKKFSPKIFSKNLRSLIEKVSGCVFP